MKNKKNDGKAMGRIQLNGFINHLDERRVDKKMRARLLRVLNVEKWEDLTRSQAKLMLMQIEVWRSNEDKP